MTTTIALLDSCVLYPAPLRDLLMHLALANFFQAKWTNAIHDEWIKNVLIKRTDLTLSQLQRTRDLMNAHAQDCLVEGYEKWIPSLTLPDENDRHVLAAAIHASATVIVTYNLKDFPQSTLNNYYMKASHPDNFIAHFIKFSPEMVCNVINKLRLSLKNPCITSSEYLVILKKQSLPKTFSLLQNFITLI